MSRKYEPHSFIIIIIQEQQNEHTLYNTFVTKMQASNVLFLRERLYGKVSALIVEIREFQNCYQANLVLRYNAKAITFQENPEDDKWRKSLPIGLPSEVQYSV